MNEKILYALITLKDRYVVPQYVPSKGIIVCRNTNDIIFRLPSIEIKKYFYFELTFDHYQYDEFYQPHSNNYRHKISKRVYKMYMYINLPEILNCNHKIILSVMSLHLCFANMNRLHLKRKYTCESKNLCHFINYRNQNYVSLDTWYLININDRVVFDLKLKKIHSNQNANLFFKRRGGIIETNNVIQTINNCFKKSNEIGIKHLQSNYLIILPNNMVELWNGYRVITYEQLINNTDFIHKLYHQYKQIIIHECHSKYLSIIKYIIDTTDCDIIWIINGLPLKYYFQTNQNKLTINHIANISNIWLNFTQKQKKIHKTSIYLSLLNKFNQYYTIVNYPSNINSVISHELQYSAFEKQLYDIYCDHFENWKGKLKNDPKNKYSCATKRKSNMLESKIYAAIIILIFSIIKHNEIPVFFRNKIQNEIQRLTLLRERKRDLIGQYKKINNLCTSQIIPVVNTEEMIRQSYRTYDRVVNKLNNLARYCKNEVYMKYEDETCQICYANEKLPSAKMICGHILCVECTLNSLGKSGKCPICQELNNVNSLVIIKDTIHNYQSVLLSFINHLPESSLLLTDINIFNNKINVVHLNDFDMLFQIIETKQINNIYLLCKPLNLMDSKNYHLMDQVIGYIMTINKNIHIHKITVKFNDYFN